MPTETTPLDGLPVITNTNIAFSEEYFRLLAPDESAKIHLFYFNPSDYDRDNLPDKAPPKEQVPAGALIYRGNFFQGRSLYYVKTSESSTPRRACTANNLAAIRYRRKNSTLSLDEKRSGPFQVGYRQLYQYADNSDFVEPDTIISWQLGKFYDQDTGREVITHQTWRKRNQNRMAKLLPLSPKTDESATKKAKRNPSSFFASSSKSTDPVTKPLEMLASCALEGDATEALSSA